jgi:probable phosphoglycerate mutase
MPGIHLNAEGRRHAHALGATLRPLRLSAVYSSPRERARETAQAIAVASDLTSGVVDELDEIDFGEWTGLSFDELNRRDDWIAFNRDRGSGTIPGGEWMLDVQVRVCRAVSRLCDAHNDATFAVVSHGDVLRALVASVIDVPIDRLDSFRIDPASVSVLEPTAHGFELVELNNHAYRDYCCSTHS